MEPFRKKKSLGQHFLSSEHYLRLIADAAGVGAGDLVLEIGPGGGALTQELLARGARVIAVEKDARLLPRLREAFADAIASKRLTLLEGDALELSPARLKLKEGGYTVAANIPYYITGALLRTFLSNKPRPSTLVFLVQKEVAARIAREKKESLLSLSVKAYGTPTYVATVPRGAFAPAPSVDSAILLVSDISAGRFHNAAHEKRFFKIIHAGFAQKRKLLRRNVEKILGIDAAEALAQADIPHDARAEDVALPHWLKLSA